MTKSVVLRRVPRLAAALRLLCALAIAVVATFHVCDIAAVAQPAEPTVACSSAGHDTTDHADFAGEKCHTCAVVSLPALTTVASAADDSAGSVAAPVRDLVSFTPRLTSPPPRA